MDFLFSHGYTHLARVSMNGRTVTLRWYPAHRYARYFPHPHAFGSNNWLSNNPIIEGIGETDTPRSWIQDRFLLYSGNGHFRGKPDWFLNGLPDDAPEDLPACPACLIPGGLVGLKFGVRGRVFARVGVALGLRAAQPQRAGVELGPRTLPHVPVGVELGPRTLPHTPVGVKLGPRAQDDTPVGVAFGPRAQVVTGAYDWSFGTSWDSLQPR